jgi:hypothetical protein
MKRLLGTDIAGSYTFNPTAKTIEFRGLAENITLDNILLITNVSRNIIIYNFADVNKGEQSFSNNVLTLTYDTAGAGMASSDVLQIFLDVNSGSFDTKTTSTDDQIILLRRIVKLMESQAACDPAQRQRITLDAVTNGLVNANAIPVSQTSAANLLATVSIAAGQDVRAVTNLTTLAGYDQRLYSDWARQAYNTGIRSQLTFA